MDPRCPVPAWCAMDARRPQLAPPHPPYLAVPPWCATPQVAPPHPPYQMLPLLPPWCAMDARRPQLAPPHHPYQILPVPPWCAMVAWQLQLAVPHPPYHIFPVPPWCTMDANRSDKAPALELAPPAEVPKPTSYSDGAPYGERPIAPNQIAPAPPPTTEYFRAESEHPPSPVIPIQTTSLQQCSLTDNSNPPDPQMEHIRPTTSNKQSPIDPPTTHPHELNHVTYCPSGELPKQQNHLAWPQSQDLIGNTKALIHRRRGRKPRSGKDYRSAPNEEAAIDKAIRTAPSRPGEAIFFPYEGTTFNSIQEAREFYNLYSWERGFGVRLNRGRKNGEKYKTAQDIICSCQGRPRNPNSASSRTGCKAHIRLFRRSDHSWYITRVDDTHNHRLTEAYGENKQWGSHGELDPMTKELIRKLRENNVSLGKICNILGVADSCTRKQAVRAMCAKISRQNLEDDIGKTANLLNAMKNKDPGLEVRFQINNNGTLKSMLWCTSKNRYDYSRFGDAVTFDTTYRTNLYSLPFGMFVGVNNHFQSVIFGGVLLTTEKTEDFEWAFKTFIDIMGGKAPITLLTDQCAAMAKARKTAMPNTRHRWCRWHVLKDAKSYLGMHYSKNSIFKKLFNKLITFETDKFTFERKWKALMRAYKLTKNKYLQRLYKYREMWAKPYFMKDFCGGMTSTQRSESSNHMLKSILQKAAPMHLFVTKFNELQKDRYSDESKEEYVTKQLTRRLRTTEPIAQHANEVYTRTMYEIFDDQLYKSGYFIIDSRPAPDQFVLIDTRQEKFGYRHEIFVTLQETGYIHCSCGLFEHMGMPCRHMLKVLTHLDKREIPQQNIMTRWTKLCDQHDSNNDYIRQLTINNDEEKRKMLLDKAFHLANKKTKISDYSFEQAMQALAKVDDSKIAATKASCNRRRKVARDIPTTFPPSIFKGGRPAHTGLKSWKASIKKKVTQETKHAEQAASDWPEEENPPLKKRRPLCEINN